MAKKLTIERFLEKSKEKHGDKYRYNKVKFDRNSDYVDIWCMKCKKYFNQRVSHHMDGRGCKDCVINSRRMTNEQFLTKVKGIHGDKYTYGKYIDNGTKIPVHCNTCNHDFPMTPNNLLFNHGCPKCSTSKIAKLLSKSQDVFIKEATAKHKGIYGYDKVVYKNNRTKIEILCKKCNTYFKQAPDNHLSRSDGCPICGKIKSIEKRTMTHEEFVRRSRLVHRDLFDYTYDIYKTTSTPFKIKCNTCKCTFMQSPHNHLISSGCPECKASRGEKFIIAYLKHNKIKYNFQHRIDGLNYPYDFYIPDYNLYIEFHGRQHYESVKHWKGSQGLIKQKERDIVKIEKVKELKANMLVLNDKDINDIDVKISNVLRSIYCYSYKGTLYHLMDDIPVEGNLMHDKTLYDKYLIKYKLFKDK